MVASELVDRPRVRVLLLGVACATLLVACRRAAPEQSSRAEASAARPAPSARPRPTLELGPLRPVPDAELVGAPLLDAGPGKPKKTRGLLGDWLDGNVYTFRAIAMKACGAPLDEEAAAAAAKAAAGHPALHRIVLGAEVEIRADANLWAVPRDVRMRSGGIYFYANSDLNRRLEGCTPLLARSFVKSQGSIRGFVLFEVPEPEPEKLQIIYQPTMFGGASVVVAELKQCVSCPPDKKR